MRRPEDEHPPAFVVTGISGAGRSTLLVELERRDWRAVDADDETWCAWVDEELDGTRPVSALADVIESRV